MESQRKDNRSHETGEKRSLRKYNEQEKDLASATFLGIRRQPLTKTAGKDWLFWWSGIRCRKQKEQKEPCSFCNGTLYDQTTKKYSKML